MGAPTAGTILSQSAPVASPYGGAYDPRLLQQQMELAEVLAPYGPREKEIDRQQAYADQLRDTKAPGMRGQGGRIQTAAHPLEFAGASAERYMGRKLGDDQQTERRRMIDELVGELRKRRPAIEPTPSSVGGFGGGGEAEMGY